MPEKKTTTYVCNWTVQHNGKTFEVGDEISLTDAEAERVLAAGAVRLKDEGKTEAPADKDGDKDTGGATGTTKK